MQQLKSPESFKSKCVDENQSRGHVCGTHTLNWEPFLCASALPELHVPFPSQSHNLKSQPFDELHEFVTGLSVIKLSPFQLLLSFFSPPPPPLFRLLPEPWGDRPPTADTLEPSWCGTWCSAAYGTSQPKIMPWRVQVGAWRINIKEGEKKVGGDMGSLWGHGAEK